MQLESLEERERQYDAITSVVREWSPVSLHMNMLMFLVAQEHGIDEDRVGHLVWAMIDFGLLVLTRDAKIALPDTAGVY